VAGPPLFNTPGAGLSSPDQRALCRHQGAAICIDAAASPYLGYHTVQSSDAEPCCRCPRSARWKKFCQCYQRRFFTPCITWSRALSSMSRSPRPRCPLIFCCNYW